MRKIKEKLPLFVLLANKDELPKENIEVDKVNKDNPSISKLNTSTMQTKYSFYKNISTLWLNE